MFVDNFRSNHELGARPRKVKQRFVVVQMGLSMWTSRELACAIGRRFPRAGTHVAAIPLPTDQGVSIANTGAAEHRTVWARPAQLAVVAADIIPA